MEVAVVEITTEELELVLAERERKAKRDRVDELTAELAAIVSEINSLDGNVRVVRKDGSHYLSNFSTVRSTERKQNEIILYI